MKKKYAELHLETKPLFKFGLRNRNAADTDPTTITNTTSWTDVNSF